MTYEEIVGYVEKAAAKVTVKNAAKNAIQIDITGEGEGALYVLIEGNKVSVAPYEYKDHSAKLVATADTLLSLVDGKLDATKAIEDGSIRVERNKDKLLEALAILAPAKKVTKKAAAKKAAPAKKAAAPKAPAKKVEAPKAPAKKAEAPKAPAKKAEAPKAPAKKVEAPKAPAKKAEAPKAPAKKAEAPKAPAKKTDKKTK